MKIKWKADMSVPGCYSSPPQPSPIQVDTICRGEQWKQSPAEHSSEEGMPTVLLVWAG